MKQHQVNSNPSFGFDPILRFPEVLRFTGARSRQTIYNWISAGNFPKPISLGANSIGWLQSDCEEWRQKKLSHRQ
ncbi:helix-turn-helix transcriptional regulator [Vibrio algarum]|uniref:AlpA family transcriptional regulator n=1 Tax=Vibrio algarum TaxID=3020714 RepID=A0ABT4YRV9_9VIBR|nr:AlpA family transcriptional regulator [Vibrio sp. KJ40-1]MDB1124276.1 AlpA family transcriptional regulator [Vibrio sp. KJ40-1]